MIRQYSLAADGSTKLSPNFKVKEFAQKGCDLVLVDTELVLVLQAIRSHFGASVTINSGYRTPEHNATLEGHSETSKHMSGRAADIKVRGISPAEVAAYADKLLLNGRICVYPTFVHVDVREERSRGDQT